MIEPVERSEEVPLRLANLTPTDNLASHIALIRETQRAYEDIARAMQRLNLQKQAIERRIAKAEGDPRATVSQYPPASLASFATAHLDLAYDSLRPSANKLRRDLEKLAMQLPAWPWVESVRGFGPFGFAQIIGECGDLCLYSNPAKVWKRMGLGVRDDGQRDRRITGMVTGYSPRRRAIMWNIGESLIKGNQDGVYHTAYAERKAYEAALHPEWETEMTTDKQTGRPVKRYPKMAHKRAQRYMEKLLLKHLWQQWHAEVRKEA